MTFGLGGPPEVPWRANTCGCVVMMDSKARALGRELVLGNRDVVGFGEWAGEDDAESLVKLNDPLCLDFWLPVEDPNKFPT